MTSSAPTMTLPFDDDFEPAGRRRGSDYADLSRRIKAAGLMERRSGYYAGKIAVMAVLFVGGWAAVVMIAALLVPAHRRGVPCRGVHPDRISRPRGGARAIFRTGRANRMLGLMHGNLAIGLSYGWWVDKHKRHHAHPNDVEKDPDVGTGALVFTAARRRTAGELPRYGRGRRLICSSRCCSRGSQPSRRERARACARRPAARGGRSSALLRFTWPLPHARLLVCRPGRRWPSSPCNRVSSVYTWAAASRPTTRACRSGPEDSADFLRRQVLTSRNVRGGPITDFVFGGLNYQIEHHLFPAMPRTEPSPGPGPGTRLLRSARGVVSGDRHGGLLRRGAAPPAQRGCVARPAPAMDH